MSFPAPVGGVALRSDAAPSIVFAALYGLVIPVIIYRLASKRSRITLLGGTAGFVVERVILFSLRADVSFVPFSESEGLTEYMQATIGMGFVAMAQDTANLLRSLLVNSTNGSQPSSEFPAPELISSPTKSSWQLKIPLSVVPSVSSSEGPALADQPRLRFWYRRLSDGINVLFVGALVMGFIGNSRLISQRHDEKKNQQNQALRYASCALVLFLVLVMGVIALWARFAMPRVRRQAASFLAFLTFLLCIPAIYRLSVMCNTTTSLTSTSPGSLNTTGAKIIFYIFHILPEWITAATLFGFNIREIFQTGFSGDKRWRDETPEEKETRERKEEEKKRKKEEGSHTISMSTMLKFRDAKTP